MKDVLHPFMRRSSGNGAIHGSHTLLAGEHPQRNDGPPANTDRIPP